MPRIRFTDRSIQAVQPPPSGQAEYFDANGRLPGFGLRVSASGRKSWVVLYRSGGRPRRLTLGPYPLLGLADARSKAKAALAVVVSGGDPAAAKRADRDAPTFAELVEVTSSAMPNQGSAHGATTSACSAATFPRSGIGCGPAT